MKVILSAPYNRKVETTPDSYEDVKLIDITVVGIGLSTTISYKSDEQVKEDVATLIKAYMADRKVIEVEV